LFIKDVLLEELVGIYLKYYDQIYSSYKEETVKIIQNKTEFDILEDSKFEPIIIALREGPLTVRELEEKYNEIVQEKIENEDLPQKQKEILKKKLERRFKTLYKYLNILEENGFVTQAGKRVVENQTATETLYGRTAKLFLFQGGTKEWINTEDNIAAFEILSQLIGLLSSKPNPKIVSLEKLYNKIENKINSDVEALITQFSNKLPKIAEKTNYNQMKVVLHGLNIILLMKSFLDFEEDLKEVNII